MCSCNSIKNIQHKMIKNDFIPTFIYDKTMYMSHFWALLSVIISNTWITHVMNDEDVRKYWVQWTFLKYKWINLIKNKIFNIYLIAMFDMNTYISTNMI